MEEENSPAPVAWDVSVYELTLISNVLNLVGNDGRIEDWEFKRRLGGSRDVLLTLLRRVNEQLDRQRHAGLVDVRAVAFWVEGVTFREWRGRTVLDGLDFSTDLEWATDDEPRPPRPLLALRGDDRLALPEVLVANVHRFSQGWEWEVIGSEHLPEPPFLLTDEADCRPVFRGPVLLRPTPWADEEIARALRFESAVPVLGDRWFGAIRVAESDHGRGYLEAFSREAVRLPRGEMVARWAGQDQEFGQVTIASEATRP